MFSGGRESALGTNGLNMFLFPLQALRDLYVKDGGSEKELENEYFKEIDIRLKCEDAVIVMSQLEAPGGKKK